MVQDYMLEGILIPGIVSSLAPESIQLLEVSNKNRYARYYTDYTFRFKPQQIIKNYKLGGQIVVDFPP